VRTQDLNHYESLARALARGDEVSEEEIALVLERTNRTREELERRADYRRGWTKRAVEIQQSSPSELSELEAYHEETKVMGAPEGLVIVVLPLFLMVVLGVLVLVIVV
jgi:hypothetical protein